MALGGFPFYSYWNGYGYPYYGCPYYGYPYGYSCGYGGAEATVEGRTYNGIPRPGDRIAVPGKTGTDSLVVEQVSQGVVRLTWQDGGRRVEEVGLFLADADQTVLVVQTLAAPPFTALLEPPPDATMAGMTVVWRTGTTSTTLAEYRAPPR